MNDNAFKDGPGEEKEEVRDFTQSYVVDRSSVGGPEETAPDVVERQVEKLKSMGLQIEKFSSDLKQMGSKTPVVAKTLANMELLEEDLGKMMMKLKEVRNKIAHEEEELSDKIKRQAAVVERLKGDLSSSVNQMADMAEENQRLKDEVESMVVKSREKMDEQDSATVRGLRIACSGLEVRLVDAEAEIGRLKREVEAKSALINEKSREIVELHDEMEGLIEKINDDKLKERLSVKMRDSVARRDPEDLEGNPMESLERENIELNDRIVNMRNEIEDNENEINRLKIEIKQLKMQFSNNSNIFQSRQSVGENNMEFDPALLRFSDALESYKQIENEVGEIDTSNPYLEDEVVEDKQEVREKIVERIVEVPIEVERIVEVPVEKIVERIVEVNVTNEKEIEERLREKFDREMQEVKNTLESVKQEKASKDILASKLKENAELLRKELETERGLRKELEEKEKVKQNKPEVDFGKNPYDDDEDESKPDNNKIEIELLKGKLDQTKRERDFYKKKADETLEATQKAPSTENSSQSSRRGAPQELQISRVAAPINSIGKSSIFITKEQEIEDVLMTSSPTNPKASLFESQDFHGEMEEKVISMKKSSDIVKNTLGISTIITKEQNEERKKILERMDMNMSSLMNSSITQSNKSSGGKKNETELQLKKALKEYNILNIRIKELKKRREDLNEKEEVDRKELEEGRLHQIEKKLLDEIEKRLEVVLGEKEKHYEELKATSEVENGLRTKITNLVKQLEEEEADKPTEARNNAIVSQSKIVLENAPLKVEKPSVRNPIPGHTDHKKLETPAANLFQSKLEAVDRERMKKQISKQLFNLRNTEHKDCVSSSSINIYQQLEDNASPIIFNSKGREVLVNPHNPQLEHKRLYRHASGVQFGQDNDEERGGSL